MIWYCVRRNGVAIRNGWLGEITLTDIRRKVEARADEVVEVCAARDFRPVDPTDFSRVFVQRKRGILGMELEFGKHTVRLAPTRMVASNLSFERALEQFLARAAISRSEFLANGRLRSFSARQYLLPGGSNGGVEKLFRGSTTVSASLPADENRAADLANGIERWMTANLAPDGSIPYKYWPSRGAERESPADNAIRRFLASWSLARLGEVRENAGIRDVARRNLRYNLDRYFRTLGDGRGAIVEATGAKLGASAIAGLAILDSPVPEKFLDELTMLAAGIESLAHEELGFRTFFFPPERDGQNWNFYSGEALLFWAEAARRGILICTISSTMRCNLRTLSGTTPPATKPRIHSMAYTSLRVPFRTNRMPRFREVCAGDE